MVAALAAFATDRASADAAALLSLEARKCGGRVALRAPLSRTRRRTRAYAGRRRYEPRAALILAKGMKATRPGFAFRPALLKA